MEPTIPGAVSAQGSSDEGDQQVFALDTGMAVFGPNENSPCYIDEQANLLYRWKGVVLQDKQLKETSYGGMPSGIPTLRPKEWQVVPFEAPIKYLETKEGFRPGYLDRTMWTFYAWKGVVLKQKELLDKSRDGEDALLKPQFNIQVVVVLEIEIPSHLKDKPELWKKK
jgi:hypothetical protein